MARNITRQIAVKINFLIQNCTEYVRTNSALIRNCAKVRRIYASKPMAAREDNGYEGFDFVTCRICGDRRRVISGRHLSKHDTDRLAYMEEYELSPDQLIAKAFRVLQSRHPRYKPNGKAEWVGEIKKIYRKKVARAFGVCKKTIRTYITKQFGFSAVWMRGIGLLD